MSEKHSENKHHFRRVAASTLALAAVGACVKFGPAMLEEITSDPSLIVAGVPGQIETWQSRRAWTGKFFVNIYWLGIEQCPSDVQAAERGESIQSFNPELGVRDAACNFDWVKVSGETLGSVTLGNTITFQGDIGQPLRK